MRKIRPLDPIIDLIRQAGFVNGLATEWASASQRLQQLMAERHGQPSSGAKSLQDQMDGSASLLNEIIANKQAEYGEAYIEFYAMVITLYRYQFGQSTLACCKSVLQVAVTICPILPWEYSRFLFAQLCLLEGAPFASPEEASRWICEIAKKSSGCDWEIEFPAGWNTEKSAHSSWPVIIKAAAMQMTEQKESDKKARKYTEMSVMTLDFMPKRDGGEIIN